MVHLITRFSLCPSVKRKHLPRGVMNNRFIHIESTTSVCLSLPPFIILFSHVFFRFLSVERCDCWVSSAGY